ncbi:MAG TPA: undecaprenyl-diphosphatase UppP [Chloroflexia bacterium]|nr:undecaprenyl-diphosphatase UppP [Chloroflexia bacterium]
MDIFQALVLGLVQGLTEFLPVSSSAHLVFVPWLFGWDDKAVTSIQFDVALHMGTLLAVLVYFAADWRRLIVAFFASVFERRIGDDPDRRLVWLIVLGTIPAALAGLLLEGSIDAVFHDPQNLRAGLLVIAVMMIVMGALLLFAERVGKRAIPIEGVRLPTAMAVGVAQALALIPGVSRSGSTITAGLFAGLKREAAARFSFLLSTPVVLAAGVKQVYDMAKEGGLPASDQLGFFVGFVASAVSGFLCISFLLRYLQRHSTAPFIWYRFMLGAALLALVLVGFRA